MCSRTDAGGHWVLLPWFSWRWEIMEIPEASGTSPSTGDLGFDSNHHLGEATSHRGILWPHDIGSRKAAPTGEMPRLRGKHLKTPCVPRDRPGKGSERPCCPVDRSPGCHQQSDVDSMPWKQRQCQLQKQFGSPTKSRDRG